MSRILLVTITVRRDQMNAFFAYERKAAGIMARHGGRIEKAIAIDADPATRHYQETHLVVFPDDAHLDAYRNDPDIKALAPLRDSCIVATTITYGTEGEDYSGSQKSEIRNQT